METTLESVENLAYGRGRTSTITRYPVFVLQYIHRLDFVFCLPPGLSRSARRARYSMDPH
jgi:hypothetical protein